MIKTNELIQVNNFYVFDDLILQVRSNRNHQLNNRKMKPWLYTKGTFLEVSIHLKDESLSIKSYKDIEAKVCDKSCLHRFDNYKKAGVKQCYVHKPMISSMNKAINKRVNKNDNMVIYVRPNNYMLRLTLHGDINQLNYKGQKLILSLCENANTVLGYTSDVSKLLHDFTPYICMSSMNQGHILIAQKLGYTCYYSGNNPGTDLHGLNDVIQCKTTIHSIGGCSTCSTPCGSSKYNVISASEDIKQNIKTLAIKSGRLIDTRRTSKGFSSYHFIYDLMLCGLIAIRLKSLIIFYFYLFIVYFFDLVDFVLSLFK